MENIKWSSLILAATITSGGLFTLTTRAAKPVAPPGRALIRQHLLERAKERLGLTEDQVAQIRAVLQADKDNLTSLISQLHEARTGLRAAIHAPDATEASVRAASAQVASVQADLAVERLKPAGCGSIRGRRPRSIGCCWDRANN